MATTLSAALFYANKGWPVLPIWPVDFINDNPVCRCGKRNCTNQGKHPITTFRGESIVPQGVANATTDAAQIAYWWRLVPDANIGVRGDTFFALDVDEEDGYLELISSNGQLPDTVESMSGGGGRHILFRQPDGYTLGNGEGTLPKGINVRGVRGYIIVPPSMHRSGNRYEWEVSSHPRTTEVATAPSWLLEAIGRSGPTNIQAIEVSSDPVDIDSLNVGDSIKDKILNGHQEGADRSSEDQKVIVALIVAGVEPGAIKAIFQNNQIGTSGKYAERGDDYLDRSISNAIAYVGPIEPQPSHDSAIVPGVTVPAHVARLEKLALDAAYLRGWQDALRSNPEAVTKMWPDRISLNETTIGLYNLGIRHDFAYKHDPEEERIFPALVVPYHSDGRLENIEYDPYGSPSDLPTIAWESTERVCAFNPDIDGEFSGDQVLITEDWDTAIHTYLNHADKFKWLQFLGFPGQPAGEDDQVLMIRISMLADKLADSERVLLAWPQARLREADLLARMMDKGGERVYWVSMPAPLREMYSTYGLESLHLNRYIKRATTVH